MIGSGAAGIAIALAIFSLFYTPIISILILRRIKVFENIDSQFKSVAQVITLVILIALTIVVIRLNPYINIDWIILYSVICTALYMLIRFFSKKDKQKL
jgi:uncharacterized membrane protein